MKYVYAFEEGSQGAEVPARRQGREPRRDDESRPARYRPASRSRTDACKAYMAARRHAARRPHGRGRGRARDALETKMGKRLGDAADPLLVSVRSGAPFSMPGMMDTVLNLGLNDDSVKGLAKQTQNERFAYDSYRRFVQMFGKIVLDVPGELLRGGAARPRRGAGASSVDTELTRRRPRGSGRDVQGDRAERGGRRRSPTTRTSSSATRSRRCSSRGTAGARATTAAWRASPTTSAPRSTCRRWCSATRATTPAPASRSRATRRPASSTPYGDFLTNAQGEDVVAGIRITEPLDAMGNEFPEPHQQLLDVMQLLENHYRDMCDIEFTIEQGRLFMLQTRVGKRTAAAALRMAVEMDDEGLIDKREAVLRVQPAQLDQLLHPQFDPKATYDGARQGPERVAGRRGRQGVLHRRRRRGAPRRRASTSSSCGPRRRPTTCTA